MTATGSRNQARGETFLVIEQRFQQVFGGNALVLAAFGCLFRVLNKPAGPVRELLEVHGWLLLLTSSACSPP